MAAVAGVTALVGAVKSLIGVGSHMMDITSQFEQTQKSLETVLQSAEKGQKLFEDLRKFSFDTTFGVDELASASSQLLNAGMAVNGLNDNLKMLGDLAQGDKNKFQELTSIFAKVQNTGRATSIQLQQLALRGIPIQKTLREMGVTGVASAEDLTKAFEKLTGEGGQFHDAMNNIIDTIEGKKGFISDTLKEINVNFAELTGITDAYKQGLDILYSILEKVNNKLIEWNENPTMKAIMSGLLATALTGIVTIIGVSLVGALATVITKLGIIAALKAAINPTGLLLGLGVAGTVGLVAGLKSLSNSEADARDKARLLNEELEKTYQLVNHNPVVAGQEVSIQLENESNLLTSYKSILEKQEENLENAKTKLSQIEAKMKADGGGLTGYEKQWERANKEVEKYTKSVEQATKFVEKQEKIVKNIQNSIAETDDLVKMKASFDEIYNGTISSEQNKLTQLNAQLEQVLAYEAKVKELNGRADKSGKLISYENSKKAIDDTVSYLQSEINKITLSIKIKNADEWMKLMQEAYGFDEDTLLKLINRTTNGGQVTKDYVQKLIEQSKIEQKTNELMGWNQGKTTKDYVADVVEQAMKSYNELLASGQFGIDENGKLDRTSKEMMEQIKSLEQVFKASGGTEEEWQKLVGNYVEDTTNKLIEQKSVWEQLTDSATAYFQSLGFGKETAQQFGQLVSNIASMSLDSLVNSCEAIGDALARGTDVGDAMKRQFASFLAQVTKSISVTCIQAGLSLIAQSGWAGVPAALGLFALGGVSAMASGFINGITNTTEQDKHNQTVKDLTDSYKKLQEAIKEQEEYYIRKKAELNMLDITDKVTKVNDMILTPHGTFSTSPQDTIIATKNPQGLGGGVVNNIKVINNAGVDVNVRENKGSNMNEILVTISKKIASDVAGGYNGWDSAFALQQQRVSGRRI